MNFLFKSENGFDTFKNYLIQESFLPKKVDYIKAKTNTGVAGVFTVKDKDYAAVLLNRPNSVEVAFTDTENMDALLNVNPGESIATHAKVPFSVLNSVFYVVIELMKDSPKKEVYFTGFNKSLDALYNKMVKNKSFLKEIEKAGYKYAGKNGDMYIFMR